MNLHISAQLPTMTYFIHMVPGSTFARNSYYFSSWVTDRLIKSQAALCRCRRRWYRAGKMEDICADGVQMPSVTANWEQRNFGGHGHLSLPISLRRADSIPTHLMQSRWEGSGHPRRPRRSSSNLEERQKLPCHPTAHLQKKTNRKATAWFQNTCGTDINTIQICVYSGWPVAVNTCSCDFTVSMQQPSHRRLDSSKVIVQL